MMDIPVGISGRSAIDVAREAASRAGDAITRGFGRPTRVSFKAPNDPVTDTDLEAEAAAFSVLKSEYPDIPLVGEESGGLEHVRSGLAWVVDPLDGTRNFVAGISFVSTVVALLRDGEPLVGVNYAPLTDEMFHAQVGGGAFLNDRAISASDAASVEVSNVGFDISYGDPDNTADLLGMIRDFWPGMRTIRVMGSSALGLSYAASGRYDLYLHGGLDPWDLAAGLLLIREAGGVFTDRTGQPAGIWPDGIIAAGRAAHADFMRRSDGFAWRRPRRSLA